jgi:tetratricopeptide (TPR) repeat protein
VDPNAHQAYLQGRYHLNMATPVGFQKAIEYFEEAIEMENNYALAYAGLATAYNYLGWAGGIAGEVYPKAKQAAVKALEIDESLPEAHLELGYTAIFYDYDWAAAEGHLERAIELNPNSSQAYLHYSWYLFSQLRAEESYAAITRASELDPLSMIIHMNQPNYYHLTGDFDKMLELSQNTLEIAPYAITALLNAGFAYCEMGLFDYASGQFERVVELTGPGSKGLLGYSYAMAGHTDKANKVLDELNLLLEEEYIPPIQIALVLIGLKQFVQAFPWLEKAYEERSSPFIPLMRTLPMFHLIRDEPRYLDLIRRLNFQD